MFIGEEGGSAEGAVIDTREGVVDTGGEGEGAAISDAEIALELGLDPADFEESEETAAGAEALADDDGSLNDNADDAAEAVESEDAAVREGDPEWFQQRIDKILKREREAQERQAQEFQAKLEALQAKVQAQEGKPEAAVQEQAAQSKDPVKQLMSFEQIDAEVQRWDQVLDFAMENLDGVDGVRGENGEVRDYSAQEMRKAWVNAKAQLRKLQERRVELAQEQRVTQAKAAVAEQARKEFPFLYDAQSVEVKALGALSPNVRQAILQDPNGLLVMGILAEGMKVTEPGKRVLKSLGVAHSTGSGQAYSTGSGQATGAKKPAQVSEQVAKQLDRLSQESAPGGPGASAKASGAAPNGAKRAELALERAYRDDNLDDITASIEALL